LKKEKENNDAEKNRLYTDRAFGGDCHYCAADGDINARSSASEETGQDGCLPIEPSSMVSYLGDVHGGHRGTFSVFSSDVARLRRGLPQGKGDNSLPISDEAVL
jgi:hypothetical protein